MTCGGSRSIKGIDADEFPVVAAIGDAPATSADARQLREALARSSSPPPATRAARS